MKNQSKIQKIINKTNKIKYKSKKDKDVLILLKQYQDYKIEDEDSFNLATDQIIDNSIYIYTSELLSWLISADDAYDLVNNVIQEQKDEYDNIWELLRISQYCYYEDLLNQLDL